MIPGILKSHIPNCETEDTEAETHTVLMEVQEEDKNRPLMQETAYDDILHLPGFKFLNNATISIQTPSCNKHVSYNMQPHCNFLRFRNRVSVQLLQIMTAANN